MATTLNTIPAEEGDTLLPKKPQASLKFQAHMGAANASTKAKKIVGAVAAAALILGVLAATSVTAGVAPTRTNLSSKPKASQIKLYADPSKCLTATGTEVGDKLVISTCGGGGGHGTKLATQQFTYSEKNGRGQITHGNLCVSKEPGSAESDAILLWWCDSGDSDENFIWDESKSKHISFPWFDGSHLCINADETKDGSPVTAVKCSSQKLKEQQWEITSDVRPTAQQIKLADSDKCLAVHNPSTAKKGSLVEVYDCASKADAEKEGQAWYYDVSHGGCFIKFVYGDTDLCVNALGGKHFQDGDAFGLFDCTYTKQEELQFIGSELPSYIELSATNSQYTMTPQSCVGKMDCNPKNGEKVVGTSEWPPAEWTRV